MKLWWLNADNKLLSGLRQKNSLPSAETPIKSPFGFEPQGQSLPDIPVFVNAAHSNVIYRLKGDCAPTHCRISHRAARLCLFPAHRMSGLLLLLLHVLKLTVHLFGILPDVVPHLCIQFLVFIQCAFECKEVQLTEGEKRSDDRKLLFLLAGFNTKSGKCQPFILFLIRD